MKTLLAIVIGALIGGGLAFALIHFFNIEEGLFRDATIGALPFICAMIPVGIKEQIEHNKSKNH